MQKPAREQPFKRASDQTAQLISIKVSSTIIYWHLTPDSRVHQIAITLLIH